MQAFRQPSSMNPECALRRLDAACQFVCLNSIVCQQRRLRALCGWSVPGANRRIRNSTRAIGGTRVTGWRLRQLNTALLSRVDYSGRANNAG